jgi:hypothetical protein
MNCSSTSSKSTIEQDSLGSSHFTNIGDEAISKVENLDNAIRLIGNQMENDIQHGSVVAIVNFDSSSESFSNYVISELNNLFIKNKNLIVAEQQKIDLVRQNEEYQSSGYVSDETMVKIGHNIGAQFIISGYLIDLGTAYRFGIYAINMQDAVRVAQSSVYLSGYDEKVAFLVTGGNRRPSEKIIPPELTRASSKAGFMQAASIMIGNSLINKIPRNSVIAITIPGGYVLADYVRNELEYILNNSNRFIITPFRDVDAILSEQEEGIYGEYGEDKMQKIGENLKADIVLRTRLTEYEAIYEDGSVKSSCEILIQILHVNTLQKISTVMARWSWPSGEEVFHEA